MLWQTGRRSRRLDYHQKSFRNPYFNRATEKAKKKFNFKMPHVSFKIIFRILIGGGLAYGLFWSVVKSPIFIMKSIDVVVPLKFDADAVRGIAQAEAAGRRFGFDENNLLILDAGKIKSEIEARFTTSNLVVKKIYPSKLFISFEEKIYEAVWHEAGKYYLISKDDESAVPIDAETLKDKKFPLIKYLGSGERYLNGFIGSSSEKTRFIVEIYANISKNMSSKIDFFSLKDLETGPIEMKVANGPRVILSEREDLDKQLKKLYTIVNEKLKADFLKKSYVDVRFGDAVYIK